MVNSRKHRIQSQPQRPVNRKAELQRTTRSYPPKTHPGHTLTQFLPQRQSPIREGAGTEPQKDVTTEEFVMDKVVYHRVNHTSKTFRVSWYCFLESDESWPETNFPETTSSRTITVGG